MEGGTALYLCLLWEWQLLSLCGKALVGYLPTCLVSTVFIHYSNDWSKFAPKTNALWLHYIVNRVSMKGRHKNLTRKQMQSRLKPYLNKFTSFDSAKHIFLSLFVDNSEQQKARPIL